MERLLNIPPAPIASVRALERELGVSFALAQVLVRRGLGEEDAARAWLAAGERHDPSAFAGIDAAVALVLRMCARARGSRCTATTTSTASARPPSSCASCGRSAATWTGTCPAAPRTATGSARRRSSAWPSAARACCSPPTARSPRSTRSRWPAPPAWTSSSPTTTARAPTASLPDAPIVHPAVCGYPCPDLCAAGVAHKLAAALLAGAGRDPAGADEDLDLVALATVADCVPLRDENRRLVREGLHALATSRKPGIRALLRVAKVDPGALDARAIGFRLAPRINAAGRLYRADAGLELVLTDDAERAAAIADELDHANAERRHTETRILFEAEAQVRELGEQPAYVLAGEGWHPGVIGIVASRIAERHHRPCVMIALDGDEGTGSGRSIPAFDLLGALDASAEHLLRHGGHRAAAGCTIARDAVDAFRAAFVEHAARRPAPGGPRAHRARRRRRRGRRARPRARRGARAARALRDRQSVGLAAGTGRAARRRAADGRGGAPRALHRGGRRPPRPRRRLRRAAGCPTATAHDATFTLELNEWNGAVEPRLVLRHAQAPAPAAVVLAGEPEDPVAAALAELAAPLPVAGTTSRAAGVPRDRRSGGLAGTLAALVASGEPVLVACADARRRRGHLEGRLGGFAVAAWHALERDPALIARFAHVVALDPPATDTQAALIDERFTVAWGDPETAVRARRPRGRLRPAPGGRRRLSRPARRRPVRRGRRRPLAGRRGPRPARPRPSWASYASTARRRPCPPPAAPSSTAQRPSAPTPRAWPRAARAWPGRGGRRGRRSRPFCACGASQRLLRHRGEGVSGARSAARRPRARAVGRTSRVFDNTSPAPREGVCAIDRNNLRQTRTPLRPPGARAAKHAPTAQELRAPGTHHARPDTFPFDAAVRAAPQSRRGNRLRLGRARLTRARCPRRAPAGSSQSSWRPRAVMSR